MSARLPIAVDAMGGDDAPGCVIAGAVLAYEKFGVPVVLVGDPAVIEGASDLPYLPATEVVAMGAEPASSVRRLKDSSIVRAAEAVRDGKASALFSAGNTGAAMAASLLRLGRIKGVSRPSIAIPFPIWNSTPSVLLDCGANADCQPDWLLQFAKMGSAYVSKRWNIARPKVALLNIGEEAGKGNQLVKEATPLFEQAEWVDVEYIGYAEGGDLLKGVADVVVCDGYTGNIVLKALESAYDLFDSSVGQALAGSGAAKDVAPIFEYYDPKITASGMLLGVRGVSMIAHGSSSAETIANGIRVADELASLHLVSAIKSAMNEAMAA